MKLKATLKRTLDELIKESVDQFCISRAKINWTYETLRQKPVRLPGDIYLLVVSNALSWQPNKRGMEDFRVTCSSRPVNR